MRPRVLLVAVFVVAVGTACAGAGADTSRPATGTHVVQGHVTKQTRVTGAHQAIVHPGVAVERLDLGPAFHPTCPARTEIGTALTPRVVARTRPDPRAPAIASFPKVNEQGTRQVFDLLQQVQGANGATWYKALLPMRPNDTFGYVEADRVHTSWTDYWLLVERGKFTLRLFRACDEIARFPVGIGTGSTPTPVGVFFLQSLLQPPDADSVYGVYAYGLSGYSDVIHDWRWGGVVGLHGTDDPSSIGRTVSHGCIRMRNADITKLARLLPLGTPISIV